LKKLLKIYFAGAIRGGRDDADLYRQIISLLQNYGDVLTEHIGDENLSSNGEEKLSDREIHDRDINWLFSAAVLIAEVTTPSLGVGYEIGRAIEHKKKILCLYRPQKDKKLSGMINGCPGLTIKEYRDIYDVKSILDEYFLKD